MACARSTLLTRATDRTDAGRGARDHLIAPDREREERWCVAEEGDGAALLVQFQDAAIAESGEDLAAERTERDTGSLCCL